MKLTAKQRLFADEYIKSGNATQSYIKAGYSVKSEKVAGVNATRMLGNARVKSYIEAKMAEIESRKIATAKDPSSHQRIPTSGGQHQARTRQPEPPKSGVQRTGAPCPTD
ncbi:terminase small subunit [Limosilactobacillus fermentum]|uniref:terminase small subunit n=1 Tax=Limosilactobacillus fermentum TaxID=1613 RepID=UPI002ED30B6C